MPRVWSYQESSHVKIRFVLRVGSSHGSGYIKSRVLSRFGLYQESGYVTSIKWHDIKDKVEHIKNRVRSRAGHIKKRIMSRVGSCQESGHINNRVMSRVAQQKRLIETIHMCAKECVPRQSYVEIMRWDEEIRRMVTNAQWPSGCWASLVGCPRSWSAPPCPAAAAQWWCGGSLTAARWRIPAPSSGDGDARGWICLK